MSRFNVVNVTSPPVLRAGGAAGTLHHQTNKGLLWTPPTYRSRFYQDAPFSTSREGATIYAFEIQNRSAQAASCGLGFRLANRIWVAGKYDGTTFTDFTASAHSPTATVTLGTDASAVVGFAIGCLVPFDWVSVNITTAEVDAGAAVDHGVQYSNAAGTGLTALGANAALTDDFTLTDTVWTATVKNFVWAKPTDWGISGGTGITGLANGYYWLHFTTAQIGAGDTAAIATGMEIGVGKFREAIADNGIYASDFDQIYSPYADGMIAYFSVANAGNMVSALVQ